MSIRRYEITVKITTDEDEMEASSFRGRTHDGEEGQTSFGWWIGCDIAEAIHALDGHFVNKEFQEIFEAIVMVHEDLTRVKDNRQANVGTT